MKTNFKLTLLIFSALYGCTSSKSNDENQMKVEKALSEWIRLNADLPDSYNSSSFTNYEVVDFSMNSEPSERYYRITHSYKLKSKDNKVKKNTHYFVLNKDFKVAIISKKATSMLHSVPPSVFEWAITFGENFKNVDYSGLDSAYYFRKFRDYKNIGENAWKDFDYLDSNCLQTLIKSLKNYPIGGMQIKRIIKATPEFETDFEKFGDGLNELGMTLHNTYGKNPQTNFAVIQRINNENETYAVVSFDETKNEFHIKVINENDTFSYSMDTSYMSTNCFIHRLKYEK